MGSTQYYVAATIDGYIAEEDGGLQWLYDAAGDPNVDEGVHTFYEQLTAVAVGASTYEIVAGHDRPWDYPGRPMFVFTHRDDLPVPEGADVRFVQGPPGDHIDRMKDAAGDGNLWVLGGGVLASQFADAGLLDELIVAYVPVVLGTGISLFARRIDGTLTLTKSEALPDGMVSNTYAFRTPSR
jgi:dihydrofolate reductase